MNVLSLFDGMSCGRIALERAGISVTTYYASEVDKYAQIVSQANYPDIIKLGDVTKWREWDIDWSSIDLLIGGSPCQGFSFAGKQLAFDDPHSKLFFVYVDILNHIRSVNPDVKFLLENVKMKKESLDIISKFLGVDPLFINSALVSAQNRQRWYWANWEFDKPEDKGIVLSDIVEDGFTDRDKSFCIDACYHKGGNPEQYFNKSRRQLVFMKQKPRGFNKGFNRPTEKTPPLTSSKWEDNHHIFCGAMRGRYVVDGKRQDHKQLTTGLTKQRIEVIYDGKTNALTTVDKDNTVVYDADGKPYYDLSEITYRKLTPIECERLQTVPDNYTNHVSNTQRYRMLGNGWTVDVIAHIFKKLLTPKQTCV